MDEITTWRKELDHQRRLNSDTTAIVAVAPHESVLDVRFDSGYGGADGPAVLIWSEDYVYFPVTYDGSEWIGSAPRNPRADGQAHVGGG